MVNNTLFRTTIAFHSHSLDNDTSTIHVTALHCHSLLARWRYWQEQYSVGWHHRRRLSFWLWVHGVWGLAPSWVQDQDEVPDKSHGPSPMQEGSEDPGHSRPEAEDFYARVSPYFVLQRCSAVLYVVVLLKLWAYCLGLNWDFRSKFFSVRRTTELFSLGAFASITPKKSAPIVRTLWVHSSWLGCCIFLSDCCHQFVKVVHCYTATSVPMQILR